MATHYIDPVDGDDGTEDDTNINTPRKTWPSSFTAGDTYAGKGGTTALLTGAAGLYIQFNGVSLTSYGTGKHIIDGYSLTDRNTIQIFGTGSSITNLDIRGPYAGNGSLAHVIESSGTAAELTIDNCILIGQNDLSTTGCNAIKWAAAFPVNIINCDISGSNVGVQLQTDQSTAGVSRISNNYFHGRRGTAAQDSDSDCIFCGTISVANTVHGYNFIISNNICEDFAENGIDVSKHSEVIIENNIIRNPYQTSTSTMACLMSGTTAGTGGSFNIIRGNYIYNYHTTTQNMYAIHTRGGHDLSVYGNIIVNGFGAVWCDQNNNKFVNNTVINTSRGMTAGNGGTNTLFLNNIFYNVGTGVPGYHEIQVDTGGSASYGGNFLEQLDAVENGGTLTDLGDNIGGENPLLDSNYIPDVNGPCYRAGKTIGFNIKDYRGIKFKIPPSIGAIEAAASRMPAKAGREW